MERFTPNLFRKQIIFKDNNNNFTSVNPKMSFNNY